MRREAILAGVLASTALLVTPALANGYHFKKVATIELQGAKGHGDIVTFDPSNKMLYVSMPNDGLDVIDTTTNKVAHYIRNIASPNGNDWDADHVYVAAADGPGAGKVNAVVVIDKKKWTEVGRITTQGTSPDWLAVDRKDHILYTDSDDKNWMEVYTTGDHPQFKAKWPLYPPNAKAGPDVATLLRGEHVIYQSDDSFVEKINTSTGAVERYMDTGVKLLKHGGTKGSIYDAKNHHLWVATTNKVPGIFVLNPETLAVIKKLPEKGGVDQVSWDPQLGLIYAFEGGAKGFDVYDANTMTHVAFVSTGVGNTHTGDVDTGTHNVYAYEGNAGVVGVYKPVK